MEIHAELELELELPEDIIGAILLKVPIKPLMRFKTVSKNWRRLINKLPFAFRRPRHTTSLFVLRQQEIDFYSHPRDRRTLSCYIVPISLRAAAGVRKSPKINLPLPDEKRSVLNIYPAGYGVICISEFFTGTVSLWNPTTDQTKVLPPSPYFSNDATNQYQFAIVKEEDGTFCYKFGRISTVEESYFGAEEEEFPCSQSLELYSSKTKSWKFIPEFYTGQSCGYVDPFFHCVNLNGKAHWVTQSRDVTVDTYVTAFDYETEVFTRIKAPAHPRVGSTRYEKSRYLVTLFDDKFLCLGLYETADDQKRTSYLDIWVMRQYGDEDSWIKEFTVGPLETHMQVVGFSSKLQCIFLRDTKFNMGDLLFCDCKSSNITKRASIGNHQDSYMQVVEHVRSHVYL